MNTTNTSYSIFSQIHKSVLFLITILLFSACSNIKTEYTDAICGLASPIVFTSDSLTLYLSDYFTHPGSVKGIIFPDKIKAVQIDSNRFQLFREKGLPALSVIRVQTENSYGSVILIQNLAKQKVRVEFDPGPNKYTSVKVRGSLNFWNAQMSNMSFANGKWIEEFELVPGEYQYLLLADGKEFLDPSNSDSIDNNMGGVNSLLKVGKYRQSDLPFLRATSNYKNKIQIESTAQLSTVIAFWQNRLIETNLHNQQISVSIPSTARNIKRSWIRVVACDADGGISNDILLPLEYGEVVSETEKLTRFDRQTMILYFMMVDRFKNGDTSNDEPVDDPEILPKANYFGGDLEGIIKVLKSGYFDELGVNTIWLSPINQNPKGAYGLYKNPHTKFSGYHGYWPISYKKIDYRFGTSTEFLELVEETHKRNMNILIDYVASHVHELHPVYQQHPDWATDLYLPDGTLNTERWDEYRLTTWFDTFLPKLDLRRPDVVEPLTDSALYWLTEFGIDGFRHDATKHIDELYWRTLTAKLKEVTKCNPMPYQIGETYGSPELIRSYVSTGMLDAQFDFNLYDDAVAVFARDNESFERLQNSLTQSLRYYGYHNQMGNITGNQDRPRFISLAGGSLHFDEDSKYAGWTRKIGVGDSSGYDKLKMLHAFNMTIPGIPVIYYGDEYGMPGANDPDNRRMMRFSGLNNREEDVKSTVKKLTSIRSSHMVLLFGDVKLIYCDDSTFAYVRFYFDEFALIVFNKSKQTQSVSISKNDLHLVDYISHFGSTIQAQTDKTIIRLEPLNFDIITNK
jgi:cyclomaltodextrinase / maltogenic alpha-amylase / neopullulanase